VVTRWRVLSRLVLICLLLGAARQAWAHAALTRSSPAADERLTESPRYVVLFFDEELDTGGSQFQLFDGGYKPVGAPAGRVDLTDLEHARMTLELTAALPDGVYIVRWAALSTDGDGTITEGEFDFIIGDGPARVKPPRPQTDPISGLDFASWWPMGILGLLGVVIALVGVGVWTRVRRSR
jgi:copper transport protein